MIAGTAAASVAGNAVSCYAAQNSCGNFHLRYGVTQSGSFDLLNNTETLAKWGYDYCEPSVVKVMSLSDADFEGTRAKIAATPVHVESMNVLLPGDLKVVGPDIDQVRIASYIQSAFVRAQALGTKIVVFGSGTSRRVPDGFSKAQAWSQLVDFLRLMGEEIDRKKLRFRDRYRGASQRGVEHYQHHGRRLSAFARREASEDQDHLRLFPFGLRKRGSKSFAAGKEPARSSSFCK